MAAPQIRKRAVFDGILTLVGVNSKNGAAAGPASASRSVVAPMPCRAQSHGESRVLFEKFAQVHRRARIDGIHHVGVRSDLDPAM